jgi:rod shape determining protein RodA
VSSSLSQRNSLHIDWFLILLVGVICAVGLINLRSAAEADGLQHHVSQLLWVILGGTAAGLLAAMDYRNVERGAYFLLVGAVFLLILVPLIGDTNNTTAQRWIDLGVFQLQPSEPAKLAVIVATARYFHEIESPNAHGIRQMLPPILMVAVPWTLVLIQPDLGTATAILLIFTTMCLFERIKASTITAFAAAGAAALPLMWFFVMHDYQKERVLSFLNPDEDVQGDAWQVSQSRIAIGSGRLLGKGYMQGTQVQNGFVPEHENDFVFANHGEQFGFVGGIALIVLYALLIFWALRIARYGRDRFAVLCAVGVSAFLFWHVVVNIGMVMGVLPVVGIWLPFCSYGGSAMMTSMMLIGILLSISLRRQVFA